MYDYQKGLFECLSKSESMNMNLLHVIEISRSINHQQIISSVTIQQTLIYSTQLFVQIISTFISRTILV